MTDELDATLCWLSDKPLRPGARVLVKHGTRTVPGHGHVHRLALRRADTVQLWTIRVRWGSTRSAGSSLRTAEPLPADDYTASRRTGSFLVIDPADGGTLAAGLVGAPLPVLDKEISSTTRTRSGIPRSLTTGQLERPP